MEKSSDPSPTYHYEPGTDHHAPAALFEPPQRKKLRVSFLTIILKFALSIGLLAALIVGYVLGLKVIHVGPVAVGLYGVVLVADFLVQLTCALANRVSVNRIVAARRALVSENIFADKPFTPVSTPPLMHPEASISIAVVGYREDDEAWRLCLRSIQQQTMRPRQVIAVVDGNEAPDLKMANAFSDEYAGQNTALIHLPVLLSDIHKSVFRESLQRQGYKAPGFFTKAGRWLKGSYSPQEEIAFTEAREAVIQQVEAWEYEFKISSYDSVCFSQPHGHKRTAMFTAFCVAMYASNTRDAIFTTDSDTLLQKDALDEMYVLLDSDPHIGGVTADVKIFNRAESWLARFCSIRYWFAFNIERGCQSFWRCVGCISGPMGLYRAYDMDAILGKWNMQTFGGKETTFGDDRHLTNQLLAHGLKTRYTHRTWCESESPTSFVRWIKQQTRWSKSFFREAFWFPSSFLYQQWWMTVEVTKQALYPFILISTITLFMFASDSVWRPVAWLTTMVGVAFIKSVIGAIVAADLWMICFTGYCVIYFFGLLPSKIYALFTMAQTTWGTSARSASEMKKGETFSERTFHVGFLVIWYTFLSTGMAFFTYRCLIHDPIVLCFAPLGLIPGLLLYVELFQNRIRLARQASKSGPASNHMTISNPVPTQPSHNVLRKPCRPDRPTHGQSGFTSVDLVNNDNMNSIGYTPSMTEMDFSDGHPLSSRPSLDGTSTLNNNSGVYLTPDQDGSTDKLSIDDLPEMERHYSYRPGQLVPISQPQTAERVVQTQFPGARSAPSPAYNARHDRMQDAVSEHDLCSPTLPGSTELPPRFSMSHEVPAATRLAGSVVKRSTRRSSGYGHQSPDLQRTAALYPGGESLPKLAMHAAARLLEDQERQTWQQQQQAPHYFDVGKVQPFDEASMAIRQDQVFHSLQRERRGLDHDFDPAPFDVTTAPLPSLPALAIVGHV